MPRRLLLQVWLDHPTQVDAFLFRALAVQPGIDLRVTYCVSPGRELLPVDTEIGRRPGWDFDPLRGYSSSVIPATFKAGFLSALRSSARTIAVVQGTNNPAFRGVMAG